MPPGRVIPSGELWAGNPAKFVRKLTYDEVSGAPRITSYPVAHRWEISDLTGGSSTPALASIIRAPHRYTAPAPVSSSYRSASLAARRDRGRCLFASAPDIDTTLTPTHVPTNHSPPQLHDLPEIAKSILVTREDHAEQYLPHSTAYVRVTALIDTTRLRR